MIEGRGTLMKILILLSVLISVQTSFARIEGFNALIDKQTRESQKISKDLRDSSGTEIAGATIKLEAPIIIEGGNQEVTVPSEIAMKNTRKPASVSPAQVINSEEKQFDVILKELDKAQ
jgi:hypothetical protein